MRFFRCQMRSVLCFVCLDVNGADRGLQKADLGCVTGRFDDHRFVLDGNNLADDAAGGGDFIADLQLVAHLLCFLILLLLGLVKEEIENKENTNGRIYRNNRHPHLRFRL